jgi:endogenous inhibitor of DNA gyrase (YacG/DUF329 family)
VNCPTCGQPVAWVSSSPFRPFCSERCKLIDLGEWAEERRAIPGESADFVPDDIPVPPEE